MSSRRMRALRCVLALLLGGCFSTHDGEEAPALRARASEMPSADAGIDAGRVPAGGNGGATISSDGEGAAGSMATLDAGVERGLQIWVGAVHHKGGIYFCGPDTGVRPQARALLLLEYDERGQLHGASLTLGEGAPLPPVEDPDAYYPPEPPWTWHDGCPMSGLVPGFEYPVHDARRSGAHLIAAIHPADVDKEWCELQRSYPASPPAAAEWGDYLCRPTDQFQTPESLGDAIPHPPGENAAMFQPEELCFNVNAPCICDADSCTASPYGTFHLDVQLSGDQLAGSFGIMEIKLERQR